MDRPLYSESAQRAVLGSALLENSLVRGPLQDLAISDFAGSSDATIFGLILELAEEREAFDVLTISEMLQQRGLLEKVGGGGYLGSLIDGAVPEPGLVSCEIASQGRAQCP